eukprot:TRINITY_DN11233_c0_g1_i1.p1 TRINITY_DN11233_c0_g1~~TRINITY_DN11233_c0_g1_i1.p1  ORF type:complete len:1090 (-),score=286.41 TRINITY_DN11233_c0_g1_i1:387-3656(-)
MAAKGVREADGKALLYKHLNSCPDFVKSNVLSVKSSDDLNLLSSQNSWLNEGKLVVKVDQLLKRRGKLGLVKLDATYPEVKEWINEKQSAPFSIGKTSGPLNTFIVEPFVPHKQSEEYYLSIYATRSGSTICFYHEGGIDVGDVDQKSVKLNVDIDAKFTENDALPLLVHISEEQKKPLSQFISNLFNVYEDLHFTYLEINPLVVIGNKIYLTDLAAKLDQTAEYLCSKKWGEIDFPSPFGREKTPEEQYVQDLDSKSGASLKLTILNPNGRIWTMVAGGGASVIYADTICDLGGTEELANYGEYSGAPSETQTYEYARTILKLMTKTSHPDGKILIIGGGIANFTNVATTFKGIAQAIKDFKEQIKSNSIKIYVRRGGPNFVEGLTVLSKLGNELGLQLYVFGPKTHMTSIVAMALGKEETVSEVLDSDDDLLQPNLSSSFNQPNPTTNTTTSSTPSNTTSNQVVVNHGVFNSETTSLVFGMQPGAVQQMLDFDYACKRSKPSVVAMIYPFSENHYQKFYWGTSEILIPVYQEMKEAVLKNTQAEVFINFASFRSAYDTSMEILNYVGSPHTPLCKIKVLAIIAEGIPEKLTKLVNKKAIEKGVLLVGPATVGGIKPGCFRIGNTGGKLDNIISSKLYRPGSVAYVSRSGGMSNELNNIISQMTDGVYEGVAIGGDRYPGSTFLDHLLRYQMDPNVKMMVLLGEVGGIEEYEICEAIKEGKLSKPLIAWCIGTCSSLFSSEVQFGHAGALANDEKETAIAKNAALAQAGAVIPKNFNELGRDIKRVYQSLVKSGVIVPKPEVEKPRIPVDYSWAQELGMIRKPKSFISSVSDERGDELLYAGVPISSVITDNLGIGGVLSLLWFQRKLPDYACKFIEMSLIIVADHGPAVSGSHNTIVAARAGKDLVSSVASGLLTIGDRFGGAIDDAARQFSSAFNEGLTPQQFVDSMRKQQKLIMGIGHKIKSLSNPDKRVSLIKEYAHKNFPGTPLLNWAEKVELITTSKKETLILNVDGAIAVCFVDLLSTSGLFSPEGVKEFIDLGSLNGLFVLGRTMGLIGHFLDQKRLKQGLYRHPWDDITYLQPDQQNFF